MKCANRFCLMSKVCLVMIISQGVSRSLIFKLMLKKMSFLSGVYGLVVEALVVIAKRAPGNNLKFERTDSNTSRLVEQMKTKE